MIEISEIKNKIGLGITNPYRVSCNNKKTYAVKFPGNPGGKKVLINEFICSELGKKLNLPILNSALIQVKLSDYSSYMKNDLNLIEGTAFGTEYNDNAMPVISPRMIINSTNKNDAIKILIFDLLVANYDRNEGNLLIDAKANKIIMIDHSHVFDIGPLWDKYQLPRLIHDEFNINKLN